VTEAETPSGAVETSLRPLSRPNRPAPAPDVAETPPETPPETPEETTTASSQDTADDVAAALAAAAADAAQGTGAPSGDPGPPLTGSERDAFRLAVQGCWVVDPGSLAATVTVTVVFELDQTGRVIGDVRLLTSSGGSASAIDSAFQNARRAVLRCQTDGYRLPPEKYEQWRLVEMTFDPNSMRLR
jgi:hypothetical protein